LATKDEIRVDGKEMTAQSALEIFPIH